MPIREKQLSLIMLANAERTEKTDWSVGYRPALQTIRRRYAYNCEHNTNSVAAMLVELAAADEARNLC